VATEELTTLLPMLRRLPAGIMAVLLLGIDGGPR
jgi:hypothetical protein